MSVLLAIVISIFSLVGLFFIVFLVFNSLGFFSGAPYAATPADVVNKLFKLVNIAEKDIVYDLGSGDGRILIASAKMGAKAIGWEINFPLYLWSIRRIKREKLTHKVEIHFGNFWNKKLTQATVIFAFLLPQYMERLEKKLNTEVEPGTKVVTYLAKLPARKPITTVDGLTIYQF